MRDTSPERQIFLKPVFVQNGHVTDLSFGAASWQLNIVAGGFVLKDQDIHMPASGHLVHLTRLRCLNGISFRFKERFL